MLCIELCAQIFGEFHLRGICRKIGFQDLRHGALYLRLGHSVNDIIRDVHYSTGAVNIDNVIDELLKYTVYCNLYIRMK